MYNNNFSNNNGNNGWDVLAASKAKKYTLGLLAISLLSMIYSVITILSLDSNELITNFKNNPNIKVDQSAIDTIQRMLPSMKTGIMVTTVVISLIFIALLWAKVKKLEQEVIPTRGVYFFIGIFSLLGLLGNMTNITNSGINGIINLIVTVIQIALAFMTISEIAKLKKNILMNNNNNNYRSNYPMNDNLNNSTMPQTAVDNVPENVEPNYKSNEPNMTYQEIRPNHQPVNDLNREQLLQTDPTIVNDIPSNEMNNVTSNEDPRADV